MSMLAESKQKSFPYQKVKCLYDDPNSFGAKMLEKMGWNKGKGLGKNEDGIIDVVKVRYKNDIKGLGYSEKDDQWTEHERQFSSLLNSLNNSDPSLKISNVDGNNTVLDLFPHDKTNILIKDIKSESLEEKSKNSKNRLHYKKFTRGKDIYRYSEKDLANIFGKKSLLVSNVEEKNQETKPEICSEKYFTQKMENNDKSQKQIFATEIKIKSEKRKHLQNDSSNEVLNKNSSDKDISQKKKRRKDSIEVKSIENNYTKPHSNLIVEDNTESSKKKLNGILLTKNIINNVEVKPKKRKKQKNNSQIKETNESTNNKQANIYNQIGQIVDKNQGENVKANLESNLSEKANNIHPYINCNTKSENKDKTKILNMNNSIKVTKNEKKELDDHVGTDIQLKSNKNDDLLDNIQISQFCAEKFRHTDLNAFTGSNLKEIYGYGLKDTFKVTVTETPRDMDLIAKFWSTRAEELILNCKYEEIAENKLIKKYNKKVNIARSSKKKVPNIRVKYLKNTSVFNQVKI